MQTPLLTQTSLIRRQLVLKCISADRTAGALPPHSTGEELEEPGGFTELRLDAQFLKARHELFLIKNQMRRI